MDIATAYVKTRNSFGRPCSFGEHAPQVLTTIDPGADEETIIKETETRLVATGHFDTTMRLAETEVNSKQIEKCDTGCTHIEGGWPTDIDPQDKEQTKRFLRKIERGHSGPKEPDRARLVDVVRKMSPWITDAVKQNNAIDITEDYFTENYDSSFVSQRATAKNVALIHDPSDMRRSATSVDWHPSDHKRMAVSYSILRFQDDRMMKQRVDDSSYIWDVERSSNPLHQLAGSSPLSTLQFNPRSPDTLIGGCYNGLLCFFDTRKPGIQPTEQSVIDSSHHDPVYEAKWIQSKTGNHCVSVSTDGQLLWWDTRRLHAPTSVVTTQDSAGNLFGGCSLAYSTLSPHKYLVGTEQGLVVSVNSKLKPKDKNRSQNGPKTSGVNPVSVYDLNAGWPNEGYTPQHFGAILSIQRNPQVPKFFMTVADWSVRLWAEDMESHLLSTPHQDSYLSAGCWSPTRPSVLFSVALDGSMNVWDLFDRQNEPVYSQKVVHGALSSVGVSKNGRLVSCGDENGNVSVLRLSDTLVVPKSTEKTGFAGMLERETTREKALVTKYRRAKREQTKSAGGAGAVRRSKSKLHSLAAKKANAKVKAIELEKQSAKKQEEIQEELLEQLEVTACRH